MDEKKLCGPEALSTEELEKLIWEDSTGDSAGDEEKILAALAVLADRQQSREEWEEKTREAYTRFRQDYLPATGGESLYEEPAPKRLPVKRLLAAAAVAAVVLLGAWAFDFGGLAGVLLSAWNPVQTEPAQPRKFQLVNLSDRAVAITDEEGNYAAVGTVTLEQRAITASIDAMRQDDGYEYTAVVTYTYYTTGSDMGGTLRTESIQLSTAERGREVTRIVYPPEYVGQICEASVSFTAVEKKTQNTALENACVSFPGVA